MTEEKAMQEIMYVLSYDEAYPYDDTASSGYIEGVMAGMKYEDFDDMDDLDDKYMDDISK